MKTKSTTQVQRFAELLAELRACGEAVAWSSGKTFAKAWKTCKRGDWMLWLASKMIGMEGWPTRQEVVLAACAVAETALKHVPAGEDRPKNAIDTTRAWCRGEATIEQVKVAVYASADAAADYASAAAAAAAYAAYAAYASAATAATAAYAAYASASAAYAAYAYDARNSSLAESANIVRKMLKVRKDLK